MEDLDQPVQSIVNLLKALAVSLLIAIAVFVTIVLPAEFGIDITGTGSMLGLNALSAEDNNCLLYTSPSPRDS